MYNNAVKQCVLDAVIRRLLISRHTSKHNASGLLKSKIQQPSP
jgi:hypothetical protein